MGRRLFCLSRAPREPLDFPGFAQGGRAAYLRRSKEEQIAVAFESMDRIARHARQSCQLGLGDVDETKHQRAVYLENGGRSDAATEAGWCWRSVSAEWLALMPGCIIAATSQPRRAGRRRIFNRRSRTRFGARFEGGDEPTPSALTQHF
ncbi:hypothetical protein L1887_50693 [Cichorium endivia]|nr:hypothetical protein L1887_50693 [Cichorium endivia]